MTGPVRYHLGGFPPTNIDWPRLVPLIGKANAALARYDGLVAAIPNASVLLSPLVTQEAVLSSKIEGTNVTMGEVLEIEAGGDGEGVTQPKRDDAEEIRNYRTALRFAAKALEDRQLTPHLLRDFRWRSGTRASSAFPRLCERLSHCPTCPTCSLEPYAKGVMGRDIHSPIRV